MIPNRLCDLLTGSMTATTAAIAISATSIRASALTMMGKRPNAANTGIVYVGSSTVGTNTTQSIALGSGVSYSPPLPADGYFDLSKIYIASVTSGDGVVFHYTPG
ncbi:MAG TPA: hypothetical protein VM487_00915 [Phycisphaerae bacterium]|nr:hypothetical protein [Phycisphaerae bacterium]